MRALRNIYNLGLKEFFSLGRDGVMLFLIAWSFSASIYTVSKGVQTELRNVAIAVVDEDRSGLSFRLREAFLLPYFREPEVIGVAAIDRVMDAGLYSFVLDIPSGFEDDVLSGRTATLQLNIDATAMTLAGNGARYVEEIIQTEVARFVQRSEDTGTALVAFQSRAKYNPNLESVWFQAVNQVVNAITMLSIILTGAAVIREREHGTISHLLVMPVTPTEIMTAKIWANALVIFVATLISLELVVRASLGVVINGSVALFALGTLGYLFAVTSLGIMLATFATTMPQFGLLSIPVFVVMNMLSGGITPMENMPDPLLALMTLSPSSHYTEFALSVLFRDASLVQVLPQLVAMLLLGTALFAVARLRFRRTMAEAG